MNQPDAPSNTQPLHIPDKYSTLSSQSPKLLWYPMQFHVSETTNAIPSSHLTGLIFLANFFGI